MKKIRRFLVPMMLVCVMVVSCIGFNPIHTYAAEAYDGIVGQFGEDGVTSAVLYNISLATGLDIESQIVSQQNANIASPTDGNTVVNPREWSQYSYPYATAYMSDGEKTFYNRLDNLAKGYLTDSTMDAYYVSSYGLYAVNGADFSDLGISSQNAFYVAEWFLYNNPQYYFLKPSFLTTSKALYMCVHDIFVDGDDRARISNDLFDRLDGWSVYATGTSAYDKAFSLHNAIVNRLSFVKGAYDQSIYSALYGEQTVCAGYSELFGAVMNSVGVPTVTVISSNHAWNKCRFDDGKYYNVDVTWDDSLGGTYLFNCTDSGVVKYDGKSEHALDQVISRYVPASADVPYGATANEGLKIPSNIHIEDPTDTTVRVVWTKVDGAARYEIEVYKDSSYSSKMGSATTTNGSIKLTGMKSGATRYARVRAISSDGTKCSDWAYVTATAGVPVTQAPTPVPTQTPVETITVETPANLRTGEVAESTILVVWDKVTPSTGYEIEVYGDSSLSHKYGATRTTNTEIKLTGMVASTERYFRIRTYYDYNGTTYYSGWTGLSCKTKDAESQTTEPVVTPVPAPVNLKIGNITETSAEVTWNYVDGVDGYYLEISKSSSFANVIMSKTMGGTTVKLTASGLTEDTAYYVRLRATAGGKDSDWVVSTFKTNPAQTTVTIVPPINLHCTKLTTSSVRVQWTAPEGATKYEIEVYKDVSYSTFMKSMTTSNTSFKLTGMSSTKAYYLKVRAVYVINGKTQYSDWSQVKATTAK